jgi:hypothetical protein
LPKENTHILFINDIIHALQCEETRSVLQANYSSLCFGSIVADTFFYSSNKDVMEISEKLHGKDGENTNELTFDLLDRARCHRSDNLLAMTVGYISHCVFDIKFHPVIYYLVGNYYDNNDSVRQTAIYRHRLMETRLDHDINNSFYLDNILSLNDKLMHEILEIIAGKYNIANGHLIKAYKKQIVINKCFRNGLAYRLIFYLDKLKIRDFSKILPLFYHHLQNDNIEIAEKLDYRDIVHGRNMTESLSNLFVSAKSESINRINAAFAYYHDRIDKAGAMQIIRGESLDTGREDCPVCNIAYSKSN